MVKKTAKVETSRGRVNIFERAVIVTLHFSNLGNHRKLDSGKVASDADKTMLHVSKTLLDAPEYRAITNHRDRWRWGFLAAKALPSALVGTATYVLPLDLLPQVERSYEAFLARDGELVEELCDVWDLRVAESKARLRGEANSLDYPPVERVRAAFSARMAYLSLGTPDSLRSVSAAVHARETEKFYQSLDETAKQIDAFLGESLAELVDWMVARLSDKEDGKKKGFGKSFEGKLAKMQDFLTTFKARNLTGNAKLDTLVEQAKGLLRGVDAEAVKDGDYRERVRNGFQAVKAVLDTMVEAKPTRRIVLED